jgi:inner membrane protein
VWEWKISSQAYDAPMHIATHVLLSWLVAESAPLDRRGRTAVTLAGIVPDLDGIGAPFEVLSKGALPWFTDYHHKVLHNGLACTVVALLAWAWCRRDWRVGVMALIAGHLHLVCDILGSRGPDGHDWPIPYFAPFSPWEWRWSGQWALNAWPNIAVTIACLIFITWLGARRGRTPLEMIHLGMDAGLVARLRGWWGRSAGGPA